jgi:hypothetical protein
MEYILNEIPSMDNIYNSDYYNKTRDYERNLANNSYKKAKNPFKTGVVPLPASSDMFMNTTEYNDIPSKNIKSLTGNNIPIENFKHGNMQPFLRKGVTQNLNLENNQNFFEKFGYNDYKTKKTEVQNFFEPTSDNSLIRGMNNNSDFLRDRTNITDIQNNYNPIKSIKVGPGLNKGYTSEGSGGFHQADTLNYAKPRDIDELRPKSDQRNTIFEIPIQAPMKSLIDKRGEVTPFSKNRPERAYSQTENNWFKGLSYLKKDSERPIENLKDTSRIGTHIDYYGSGKNQIEQFNNDDNYGKNSILVYDTEKHEISKKETPIANITSVFKGMIAPVTDAIKITFKEYFIDNPRIYGNAIPQSPEKQTTYDPVNHIMKTTVKETTSHDSENLNLTGSKETYSGLYDDIKTTTKETTIHDSENINLSGSKETYSALYDNTKKTTKETSLCESDKLNLTGSDETYSSLYDNAKKTTKETSICESDKLNLSGSDETYSALYDNTKTTVKETTIHDTENLNLTGSKETYSDLYDDQKTTVKETLIHDNYDGNIKVRDIGYYKNGMKTKTTLRQTLPEYDTARNINNKTYYSTYTYDPKIIAKRTVKETTVCNNNNEYGFISGIINSLLGGYINKEVNFKNTQRQYSHCQYNGTLKSTVTHIPTDRDADYNQEIDGTRELIQNNAGKYIAKGAGTSKGVDKTDINMQINKQIDIHECAEPIRNPNKIYQSRPIPIENENITRVIEKNNAYTDRLDSSILSSLIENPDIIKINPIRVDCEAI